MLGLIYIYLIGVIIHISFIAGLIEFHIRSGGFVYTMFIFFCRGGRTPEEHICIDIATEGHL